MKNKCNGMNHKGIYYQRIKLLAKAGEACLARFLQRERERERDRERERETETETETEQCSEGETTSIPISNYDSREKKPPVKPAVSPGRSKNLSVRAERNETQKAP